ncbi:hypothetical protein LSM04_003864 [Trypanosoma melophagium]|uniref:uncharacterized protein n=1 Tax=Trypanosoma melophagium TaxID=715481 RepID=UPI00351A4FC6|nr:hypothetical protein LSM04_003864 [Trypanosoma melophagium]
MSSWKSAVTCYEFFRKRHFPIADEAIMSIYLRLCNQSDDSKADIHISSDILNIFSFMGCDKALKIDFEEDDLFSKHCDYLSCNDVSQKGPNALNFLLYSTQNQSTLRPLYHRLRFILQSKNRDEEFGSGDKKSIDCNPDHIQKLQNIVSLALPVLSAPSSILNISLNHNLRKGRWIDALRTIHNVHQYRLLEPYLKELSKVHSWSGTSRLLAVASQDACYRSCVDFPSLVSLMEILLEQWETYWNTMKGATGDRHLVRDLLFPSATSFSPTDNFHDSSFTTTTATAVTTTPDPSGIVDSNGDDNRSEKIEGISSNVGKNFEMRFEVVEATESSFLMRSKLEKSSLEVLRFASYNTFYGTCQNDMKIYEEQEVCHRLMEVATRIADFSFCCHLADAWSIFCDSNISGKTSVLIPSSATRELLLTRLLLRAPSCEVVLNILNGWTRFSATNVISYSKNDSRDSDTVATVLRCPEVVSVLAYRLPPAIFVAEIVEKLLHRSEIVLSKEVRDIVRDTLNKGGYHDAAEKFCMRQAQLEMVTLRHSNDIVHMRKSFVLLVEEYLSQKFSIGEKVQLFSNLFYHAKETEYVFIINALLYTVEEEKETIKNSCYNTANTSRLSIIVQVMCKWILEDHRPGDATVILHHILNVIENKNIGLPGVEEENLKEKSISLPLQNLFSLDDVINLFFESVSRLGFLLGNESLNEEKFIIALQWLKLLSELPSKHFDESTIVVWLFWTMRAVVQYEEEVEEENSKQRQGCLQVYTPCIDAIKTEVVKAVSNLSRSLENCEPTAILPPMLLNWLVSHADMIWSEATALITRYAGVKASQKLRFVFIRLPLGNTAFDTLANPDIKKRMILAIEAELRSSKFFGSSNNWYLIFKQDLELKQKVNNLFTAIRFTILHAWYRRILNPQSITKATRDDVYRECSFPNTMTTSHHKRRSLVQVKRKLHHDNVMSSLNEALQCLWEQTSFKKKGRWYS